MPKTIDIGRIKAHLDTKTGVVRLTSKEPNSELKKRGFMVNIKPGSDEYEMLLNAIIGNNYSGISDHDSPNTLILKDKFRVKMPDHIPLGLDIDDNETIVHWNNQSRSFGEVSTHLYIEGKVLSGKTTVVQSIIDHLSRQHEKTHVMYQTDINEMDSLEKKLSRTENIEHYSKDDPSILDRAHVIMQERQSLKANSAADTSSLSKENKPLYVIIDGLEESVLSSYNAGKDRYDKNKSMLTDLLRMGRDSGIHVVLSSLNSPQTRLSHEAWSNLGMKVETMKEGDAFRADVLPMLGGDRQTIVPFHVE